MRPGTTAAFALLVSVLNPGWLPAQQDSISSVVVATRTDADERKTLLVKTPAVFAGRAVDEVRLRVGRDIARAASAALLPGGWSARADGAELRLAGAATAGADSLVARFVVPGVSQAVIEALTQARIELFADGDRLARADVPVERRPAVDPDVPLDEVLGLPPVVAAGDTITLKPYDLTLTPYGGTWEIESVDEAAADPELSEPAASEPKADGTRDYSFNLKLGASLGADLELNVKYTDEWGDVLVDVEPPTMEIIEEPPGRGASITGCTQKSFRGRIICVCGSFPDEAARARLTIDGAPLGEPLTSSRHVLYFRLPQDVAAGPHTIALAGAAGTATVEVLELAGQIDQSELLRGESTPIHIRILGTRDALSLRLANNTPGIITLDGGNEQVITTSGGETNSWTGRVQGHTPGDFRLTYELTAGRCPCAELASTSADLPEGETWYDDTFGRFKRGRDLADDAHDAGSDGDANARDLAKAALDELARAREALKRGVASGDIGPESARLFEEYISRYESQARSVTAPPPPVPIEDDGGDDPRDTPPPVIYGEEIDPPMIVVTDGWFQPSQGVWQDDDDFKDAPGKQLTRVGTAEWRAELKMVAGRYTALFGIRDDTGAPKYQRIHLEGETTATRLAKVRFRFTLIQGGRRVTIYEQPSSAAQNIWMDGPAGPKRRWRASLLTTTGVPAGRHFTFDPGSYAIEAELIRDDNGQPTGLKAVVRGEAVTTTAPVLNFVPVALYEAGRAGRAVLGARAQRLATAISQRLPDYLPVRNAGGITATAQPLKEFPEVQPGALRELVSLLPFADDSDTVRKERLTASLTSWLTTQAALTGGGKVVAVLQNDELNSLFTKDNTVGYALSQKLMLAGNNATADTIGHELTHTTPFIWSRRQMQAAFGFSYHNNDDQNYADGVRLLPRTRHDSVTSMMGPATFGSLWIAQGTYWHLLEQFQAAPDPPLIVARGYLGRADGRLAGRLDALYQVMGVPDLETRAIGPGEVAVELRDAAGAVLGRFPFAPGWSVPDVEIERSIVSFTFTVPDLEGTAEIALVGPDGVLLHSRRRSASAPAVEILSPAAGARVTPEDERLRVTWRGSDADGDELSYVVLYSPDDGRTWRVAGYEVEGTSFEVPIVGRPAAPRVRVIATDGARSATAEVGFSFAR